MKTTITERWRAVRAKETRVRTARRAAGVVTAVAVAIASSGCDVTKIGRAHV